MTTDGNFTGVVGQPVIDYHHIDGLNYSDFMEVFFVDVPSNYTADTFKSTGDIMQSGAEMMPSGAIVNMPIVPTGATLQSPETFGTDKAPINPLPVWYKGQEIWTYVFEVTTAAASEFFRFCLLQPPVLSKAVH